MAGIEEAVTCAVCSEVYQTKKHEPVMVPCGHVFCRSCLTNIERTGDLTCPSCRKDLNHLHIQDLPTCFPLLSLSSSYDTFQFNTCSEHGDDLMYWCQGCQLPLCGLCLYTSHPHGHDVRLASTCVQEKKQALQGQVNTFKQTIDGKKKEIKKRVGNCILKIKKLCQNSSQLHAIGEDLAALSKETTEACNIESILISEAKVKSLQEKQLPFVSSSDVIDVDDITEEDCLAVGDTAAGKSRASAAAAQQQTPPGSKQAVNKCWARLECQDGRLLLHTLSSPIDIDSRLFLQIPSEVFLEVSVGNRCLGRVYIRLWHHLRRAQHFLALCHGTLGPSYVGASFVVSAYGEERETLDVRKYVLPDGSTSNKVLIADMEWGGKFAGPANERTVMGSCHGADTHGFGICTRSQPNGTFQCPFGEVSSGMEIIKAVINHNPISEVTVTDCGLVIPEFKP